MPRVYMTLLLWVTTLHLPHVSQGLICMCDDPDDQTCMDGICEIEDGSCVTYYSILSDSKFSGCALYFSPPDSTANFCNFPHLQAALIISMCCNDGDRCNERFDLTTQLTTVAEERPPTTEHEIALIVSGVLFSLVVALIAITLMVSRTRGLRRLPNSRTSPHTSSTMGTSDICLTSGSGSGAGQPMLAERTVAREVAFKEEIGKGRYGTVWRGEWRGVSVAVKTFDPRESDSWMREVEIYQTHMLNHSNILHFIASDSRDKGAFTQFLLITEYHRRGSLFDFLNNHILDVPLMLKFAESITDGLNYLHREIVANKVKPCIAHRDLKSKNILVKEDNTCCIADLGLAVRHDSSTGGVDIAVTNRVGTKRYMAPEVLDETIMASAINSYKLADIYSLALVFWELFMRCQVSGKVDEYEVPYFDRVTEDPSVDEMRNVVCVENYRPRIPSRIEQHEKLSLMVSWVHMCWHEKATVRLTTLRLLKNIRKIRNLLPTVIETELV